MPAEFRPAARGRTSPNGSLAGDWRTLVTPSTWAPFLHLFERSIQRDRLRLGIHVTNRSRQQISKQAVKRFSSAAFLPIPFHHGLLLDSVDHALTLTPCLDAASLAVCACPQAPHGSNNHGLSLNASAAVRNAMPLLDCSSKGTGEPGACHGHISTKGALATTLGAINHPVRMVVPFSSPHPIPNTLLIRELRDVPTGSRHLHHLRGSDDLRALFLAWNRRTTRVSGRRCCGWPSPETPQNSHFLGQSCLRCLFGLRGRRTTHATIKKPSCPSKAGCSCATLIK